jgi:ubiquinone/menaquinone biosynthesis C-methylase UbiE
MTTIAAQIQDTQRAFDGVAPDYDGPLGNNTIIQRMRGVLWRTVAKRCPRGARLLDVGCGTGLDAVHFARLGYHMLAIDSSPAMVARTRERVDWAGVGAKVRVELLDLHRLDQLAGECFTCIYSDLGPLNCALDLPKVSRACRTLLNSEGSIVASLIGRFCPWEIAYFCARLQFRRAFVRLRPGLVPVPLRGERVWTRYMTPLEFYRAFAADFKLTRYRALGLVSPPPYLGSVDARFPTISTVLGRIDNRVSALPLTRDVGDHFLMVLTKRG